MRQPTFFDKDKPARAEDDERVVLYALGDFQARGKVLAGRDLPLDRLRGALRRAAEAFGVEELGDEQAAAALGALGASVRRVPIFFAKHPFRVVVPVEVAERAREYLKQMRQAEEQ
ncbi:MAG: hypothetical protein M3444_12955 [Acidobacteriota bacterium]|nr:hypothetical protein [Acidobacteriota bacterium]MDQ5838225.1 hypothetical protein [Acidobacteriota bacterium]